MRMQHVITQKDLTSVHVILDTVVMDLHAMVKFNARHNYGIKEATTKMAISK